MTFEELNNLIGQTTTGDTLLLGDTVPLFASSQALRWLGVPNALTINQASVEARPGVGEIAVTGRARMLGLDRDLRLEGVFHVVDGQTSLELTLTPPRSWKLADSFFSTERTFLGDLPLPSATIRCTIRENEPDLRIVVTVPIEELDIDQATIIFDQQLRRIRFTGGRAAFAELPLLPGTGIKDVFITLEKPADDYCMRGSYRATVVVRNREIPFYAELPTESGDLELGLAPHAQVQLPSLEEMAALVGLSSLATMLPKELIAFGSGYAITEARIAVDPATASPTGVLLAAGAADPAHEWTLVPGDGNRGLLCVRSVGVRFETRLREGTWHTGAQIGGTFRIGATAVPIRVEKPPESSELVLTVADSMQSGGVELPSFGELLQLVGGEAALAELPPAFALRPGIMLRDIEAHVALDAASGTPSLTLFSFAVDWKIALQLVAWLQVESAFLHVVVDNPFNGATTSAAFGGTVRVAGAPFLLTAKLHDQRFEGGLVPGAFLDLIALAREFLGERNTLHPDLAVRFGRASVALDLRRGCVQLIAESYGEWSFPSGWLTIQLWDVIVDVKLEGLNHATGLRPTGKLGGKFRLDGVASGSIDIRLDNLAAHPGSTAAPAPFAFTGELHDVSVSKLVESFLPKGTCLPPEVPDITFKSLALSVVPGQRVEFHGQVAIKARLPLGDSELDIESAALDLVHVKGQAPHFTLHLAGRGQITEDVVLNSFGFDVKFTGPVEMSFEGWLEVALFKTPPRRLSGGFGLHGGRPRFHVEAKFEKNPLELLNVGGARLTLLAASLAVARHSGTATRWDIRATSDFEVGPFKVEQGSLHFLHDETRTLLELTVASAVLPIPLGAGWAPVVAPAFDRLLIERTSAGWKVDAAGHVTLSQFPPPLDRILADRIDASLLVSSAGATLLVSRAAKPIVLDLTRIPAGDGTLDLGRGLLDVRNLRVTLGSRVEFGADVVLGIPNRFNHVFGSETRDKPSHAVFRTYEPEAQLGSPEECASTIVLTLTIGERGLEAKLSQSPFVAFTIVDGEIRLDTPFGLIYLGVPTFKLESSGRFTAAGKLRREGDLQLPLVLIRLLLQELARAVDSTDARAAKALRDASYLVPKSIPIKTLPIFIEEPPRPEDGPDAQPRVTFDVGAFDRLLRDSGAPGLPPEVKRELDKVARQLNRLPDRFRRYLQFELPKSFDFRISGDASGSLTFHVDFDDVPLRLLVPGFPSLQGIELYRLSFGEIAGGSLLLVEAKFELDDFDLLSLAASMLIPFDQLGDYFEPPHRMQRRIIVHDLYMPIVYQAGVPIPVPLFFSHLGLSLVSLDGTEVQSHFHMTAPQFEIAAVAKLISQLYAFLTKPDALLDPAQLPPSLDLTFTAGSNFIKLPKFAGGEVLGFKDGIGTLSAFKIVSTLLNAAKKASVNELITAVPLQYRALAARVEILPGLEISIASVLSTPHEFLASAYQKIALAGAPSAEAALAVLPVGMRPPIPGQPPARPPEVSRDEEGIILFLGGKTSLAQVFQLDAMFGLAASGATGFGVGLGLHGALAGVLDVSLGGAVTIAPGGDGDAFRIQGDAIIRLGGELAGGGRTLMRGSFVQTTRETSVSGMIDVFGDNPSVAFRHELRGHLDAKALQLDATGELRLPGFQFKTELRLRAGRWTHAGEIRCGSAFMLAIDFMGGSMRLEAARDGGRLLLAGSCSDFNLLGGLLVVRGSTGGARLEVEGNVLRALYLKGSISLLGISDTETHLSYDVSRFSLILKHRTHLPGLHSRFDLACSIVPGSLTADTTIALFIDLMEALAAIIKALLGIDWKPFSLETGFRLDVHLELEEVFEPGAADDEMRRREQERDSLREDAQRAIDDACKARERARAYREQLSQSVADAQHQKRQREEEHTKLISEIERLKEQIAEERELHGPDGVREGEFMAKVEAFRSKAAALGGEVAAYNAFLQSEVKAFELKRLLLKELIRRKERERSDAARDPRLRDKAKQLEDEIRALRREDEVYSAKSSHLQDAIPAAPDGTTVRSRLAAAARVEAEARKQLEEAGATGQLNSLRTHLNKAERSFEVGSVVPRPLMGVRGKSSSRFLLRVSGNFSVLGAQLTLPPIGFERHDLPSMRDHGLLTIITTALAAELRENLRALLTAALSPDEVVVRIARFVFDPTYRDAVLRSDAGWLNEPGAAPEMAEQLAETARFDAGAAKQVLRDAGWSAEDTNELIAAISVV